jgi:hypothetical protein
MEYLVYTYSRAFGWQSVQSVGSKRVMEDLAQRVMETDNVPALALSADEVSRNGKPKGEPEWWDFRSRCVKTY